MISASDPVLKQILDDITQAELETLYIQQQLQATRSRLQESLAEKQEEERHAHSWPEAPDSESSWSQPTHRSSTPAHSSSTRPTPDTCFVANRSLDEPGNWAYKATQTVKYYVVLTAPRHPDHRYNFDRLRGIHHCKWDTLCRKFHGRNPQHKGWVLAGQNLDKAKALWLKHSGPTVAKHFEGEDGIAPDRT